MNDLDLKNKLLKDLVKKRTLNSKELLKIFGGNKEELYYTAKEFKKFDYAKSLFASSESVENMHIMHEGKVKYKSGGFKNES